MWLSKIDKRQIWNSKVELTLWELHNMIEELGGSFNIERNFIIFRNPVTKKIYITSLFCNACKHEYSKNINDKCNECDSASEFEWGID